VLALRAYEYNDVPRIVAIIGLAAAFALASGRDLPSSIALDSPPARLAQPTPSLANLSIALHDRLVRWEAAPGSVATADLYDGQVLLARAEGIADVNGDLVLVLGPVATETSNLILPGQILRIELDGVRVADVDIPYVAVDVIGAVPELVVKAPPHADVRLRVFQTPIDWHGSVTTGANGLATVPVADLPDAKPRGIATYQAPSGPSFSTRFAAFDALVEVGGLRVGGQASAGSAVEATSWRGSTDLTMYGPVTVASAATWAFDVPAGTLVPGMGVTITHRSPVDHVARITGGIVPNLSISVLASTRGVVGTCPAGRTVVVTYPPPSSDDGREVFTCDASERFAIDFVEPLAMGISAQVTATVAESDDMAFVTRAVMDAFDIAVYGQEVRGTIDVPGASVALTLLGPDEVVKSAGRATARAEAVGSRAAGSFVFSFDPSVRIEPGDTVVIDWRDGDPLRFPVPMLTALVDVTGDAIHGSAPPGARLEVNIGRLAREFATRVVLADAAGEYRVDYGGEVDLDTRVDEGRNRLGTVSLIDNRGARYRLAWTVIDLTWYAGAGLTVRGADQRDVVVTQYAADGRRLGAHVGRIDGGSWKALVRDDAGWVVAGETGDRFIVELADDRVELELLPLTAVVLVDANRLVGQTAPGHSVRVQILSRQQLFEATAQADAVGRFEIALDDVVLAMNEDFQLTLVLDAQRRIVRELPGPGLTLDIDEALVSGVLEPDRAIAARLGREGSTVASADGRTSVLGRFILPLRAADDGPVEPRPGDVLEVVAEEAQGASSLSLRIPRLSIDVARDPAAVFGDAEPGGTLQVLAHALYLRPALDSGSSWFSPDAVAIDPDGGYRVVLPSPAAAGPDLRPGQRFVAVYTLPDGHRVQRQRILPMLHIEHGGARACGFARPGSLVHLERRDGQGVRLAGAETVADGRGWFSAVLRSDTGQIDPTEPPAAVEATFDDQRLAVVAEVITATAAWSVPHPMRTAWRASRISAVLPPGHDVYIFQPGQPCTASPTLDAHWLAEGRVGLSGAFQTYVEPIAAGTRLELALFDPLGHRVHRRIDRALLRAFVDTTRIEGHAIPLTDVRLTLFDDAGAVRAQATAAADLDGSFATAWRDVNGRPVLARPGDSIEADTAMSAERLLLAPLSIDFSTAGLVGRANGADIVHVTASLSDGRVLAFERPVARDGSFSFRPTDLPIRNPWSLGDVRALTVARRDAAGHEVATYLRGEGTSPGEQVYLPLSWR